MKMVISNVFGNRGELRAKLRAHLVSMVCATFFCTGLLSMSARAVNANCYLWNYTWYGFESQIRNDPEEVCNEWWESITDIPAGFTKDHMTTNVEPLFPHMHCYGYRRNTTSGDTSLWWQEQINVVDNPIGCKKFVSAKPEEPAQCGPTCSGAGDPINPATGAVFGSFKDAGVPQGMAFSRAYDSKNDGKSDLGKSWRHTFSRSIKVRKSSSQFKTYAVSPDNSSLYADEAAACTNGFEEIKGRVNVWSGATAIYDSGACKLNKGSAYLGTLPIYYQSFPTPAPGTQSVIAYDAIRDDGQQISFSVFNGKVFAPAGIAKKINVSGSAFTITNEDDSTEVYNSYGTLLLIRSRGGVVQTMNYDGLGNLSSVVDSFGHTMAFEHDENYRLLAVKEQ